MAHAQPSGMILVADPMRLTADILCRRLRADGFDALALATIAAAQIEPLIEPIALAAGGAR